MPVSRRRFVQGAVTAAAGWPLAVRGWQNTPPLSGWFQHGVASGDPSTDRVILWTRVTPRAPGDSARPIEVRWRVAADDRLTTIVARGTEQATEERDFTVKVDVAGLRPGGVYYYSFDTGGEQSPIGRTRTLPDRGTRRLRLGQVSCSNYPTGYFNAYRCLANREELDLVVHLGDYIYEFPVGQYADPSLDRAVTPAHELLTLDDYRARYAFYRRDIDLQEVHRQHPFVVVWDDHETANDGWSGGAQNHQPEDGDWRTRQLAAYRAYLEWLPIREARGRDIRLYRSFRFGDLADLIMLDTRGLRDQQVRGDDARGLADPRRTLLGETQERWLSETLRRSQSAGTAWRLLGQQIVFSPMSMPGTPVWNTDIWEGYPAARQRVFDMIVRDRIADLAIMTGDIHSSWAFDVEPAPWSTPGDGAGARPVGIELVAPAVSSPPLFLNTQIRDRLKAMEPMSRHWKFVEGEHRGYVLLDLTPERLQADWYFMPSVTERSDRQVRAASFICERGSSRLVRQLL